MMRTAIQTIVWGTPLAVVLIVLAPLWVPMIVIRAAWSISGNVYDAMWRAIP